MQRAFLSFFFSFLFLPAHADSLSFTNLSQEDFDAVIEDLGALHTHTSVSPASTLGKIFGFEVGVVFGAAKVPEVEKLVKESDPNAEVSVLPHVGLLGALSLPLGFKFEISFLPEKELSDVNLKYTSLAVQWTMTDSVLSLPVELALKLHRAHSILGFTQDVGGSSADVDVDNKISGLALLMSQKFTIFEPYIGVGAVKVNGEMTVSNNEFFDFTDNSSATSHVSGGQYFAGINFNLIFLKLGAEVGRIFDNNKASLKLSMAF